MIFKPLCLAQSSLWLRTPLSMCYTPKSDANYMEHPWLILIPL